MKSAASGQCAASPCAVSLVWLQIDADLLFKAMPVLTLLISIGVGPELAAVVDSCRRLQPEMTRQLEALMVEMERATTTWEEQWSATLAELQVSSLSPCSPSDSCLLSLK